MSKAPTFLLDTSHEIGEHLSAYFDSEESRKGLIDNQYAEVAWQLLKEFSLRPSKRVRGSLAVLAYKIHGGQNKAVALDLSIVVEMVQNAFLIIDDVMDKSIRRRGEPSLHIIAKSEYSKFGQIDSHGANMIAICVGNIGHHLAVNIMSGLETDQPKTQLRAIELLTDYLTATEYGQILDLANQNSFTNNPDSIEQATIQKSSHYTFIGPMQLGALIAGADKVELDKIYKFGLPAGLAFQIKDDILGTFGNSSQTGKSNTDDLAEGKRTLMVTKALENSQPKDRKVLENILGSGRVSPQDHQTAQQIIRDSGGLEYAMQLLENSVNEALEITDANRWPKKPSQDLRNLVHFIAEREQ